jgi:hypothetical protein
MDDARCLVAGLVVDFHAHVFPGRHLPQPGGVSAARPDFRELYRNPGAVRTADELLAEMNSEASMSA